MENPRDFIQVDINALPVIEDVVAGNQFIIETVDGTKTINYENVIFGPDNTSFYDEIVANTSNIEVLSTQVAEISAATNVFVSTTTASAFSSEFIPQYYYQLSSLNTQAATVTATFQSSYINDAYIPRTPFGVKAAGIFNSYGSLIQNTANVTNIIAAKDSSGIPTGRYVINLNGLSNNNYVVQVGAAGKSSNLRNINAVVLDKSSSSLVIQTSGYRSAANDASSIYFVIYSR